MLKESDFKFGRLFNGDENRSSELNVFEDHRQLVQELALVCGQLSPGAHQITGGREETIAVNAVVRQKRFDLSLQIDISAELGSSGLEVEFGPLSDEIDLRVIPFYERTDRLGTPDHWELHFRVQVLYIGVDTQFIELSDGTQQHLKIGVVGVLLDQRQIHGCVQSLRYDFAEQTVRSDLDDGGVHRQILEFVVEIDLTY